MPDARRARTPNSAQQAVENITDSTAVVIGPNNFDRNPRYNYGNSLTAKGGLVFRNSHDGTLTGLHVNGVERQPAAVVVEKCDRFQIANSTILDSDNVGLLLRDVTRSRVGGMLIRDDRKGAPAFRRRCQTKRRAIRSVT